ncbi:MAG: NUDIX domain-containing protein [Candidatus Saccharimonas aalborgensis]
METKVLIVAVVENDGSILMRKKPDGSPPYKETWYIFGATATPDTAVDEAVKREVKAKSGVDVVLKNKLSWDTEIKNDLDGVRKFFIYLDVLCEYVGGDLVAGADVEKLEWVDKSELAHYDIVPPSRVLFEKLGYIRNV